MDLPLTDVRDLDATLEPEGFTVEVGAGTRIHFLDWGVPAALADSPALLAIHGLGQTAWIWTPIARRLGGPKGPLRCIAIDLRGHGLSDAPTEDGAYDLDVLADDVLAAAEGSGAAETRRFVLAGHGFGAIVAATAARRWPGSLGGLLLVDGGWESMEEATGVDADEFLRGLDEPPEVMASLAAFLADRRGFDPRSWDNDQERAARATIVETHAGRVVPSARPHATEAIVRTMFGYDPLATLVSIDCPILAISAADDDQGSRAQALRRASAARADAGRDPIDVISFPHDGHNLMRYRPREVAAAVLALARPTRPT